MTVAEINQLALDFSGSEGEQGNLPEGWGYSRLGDVLTVNYGKGLKQSDRAQGPVPVYGSNGVVGSHDVSLTDGPAIIIGRKGSAGAVHYSSAPSWPIDTTYFVEDFNGFDPIYLLHSLRALNLAELDTSTAIPGLNRDKLYAQGIPVPPLAEQKRIAAKVEALLARVNAARGRLERVPVLLKRFRQAVLAAACSGRLTEEQSSETWTWTTLEQIAAPEPNSVTDGPFGSNLKTEHYTTSGPRVIRLQNIGDGFFVDARAYISQEHFERLAKHQIFPGDVVIGALGDPLPRACLVPETIGPAIVKADCIRFKPHPELADSRYMSYVLNDRATRTRVAESVHGVGRARLNLNGIKSIPVPLPPLPEQREIVRRVEALFVLADVVEKRVEAARARAERLTQAILAKPFRGELVPTEAELARREGRPYEPAGVLLAKIRAKRERAKSQKRGSHSSK